MINKNFDSVQIFDYYYDLYAGHPGWEFSYLNESNILCLFTMYAPYFENILDFLHYCIIDNKCEILEKYLEGGGMFIDDKLLDDIWVIKDKSRLIENLHNITRGNFDKIAYSFLREKKTDDDIELVFSISKDLIIYLIESKESQLELVYI